MKVEEILNKLIEAEAEKREAELEFFNSARENKDIVCHFSAKKYDEAKEKYEKIHQEAFEYVRKSKIIRDSISYAK